MDDYQTAIWRSFLLDQAVFALGTQLQEELEGVEDKNKAMVELKRNQILARVLGKEQAPKQKYRDPAALFGVKKKTESIVPPPKPFPEE